MSSVVRALRVLDLLAHEPRPVRLAEISVRLGIPKSTAHGILRDLVAEGFADQPEPAAYTVGIKAFEVGAAHVRSRGLEGSVLVELVRLSRRLEVTAHYAVLDGGDVVYLAKEDAPGLGVRLASAIGARLPAASTAVGKAAIGALDPAALEDYAHAHPLPSGTELAAVRRDGWARDDGDTATSVVCVAAPVRSATGPAGAVGVSFLKGSLDEQEVVTAVLEAAARVTVTLGGRGAA